MSSKAGYKGIRRDLDGAYRAYFIARVPVPVQSAVIAGATPANGAILEIPYIGRAFGAIQIASSDGNATTGTYKVQGTLMAGETTLDGTDPATVPGQPRDVIWPVASRDSDYADVAGGTITNTGIFQIPANTAFSRIRVICTSAVTGLPVARAL